MVEKYLEQRISTIKRPNYLRLPTIASKMEDVINLGSGDPDFETPKFIRDAAIKALDEARAKRTRGDCASATYANPCARTKSTAP